MSSEQTRVASAVEELGEAFFHLSDKMRGSGFLSDDANRAEYEAVVAAFQALEERIMRVRNSSPPPSKPAIGVSEMDLRPFDPADYIKTPEDLAAYRDEVRKQAFTQAHRIAMAAQYSKTPATDTMRGIERLLQDEPYPAGNCPP